MAEPLLDLPVRIYPCPLPDCEFVHVCEGPGPAEQDGTLADVFGWGVFGAHARNERLQRTERELAAHLATHTVQEFAIALANANKRIAELTAAQEAGHG